MNPTTTYYDTTSSWQAQIFIGDNPIETHAETETEALKLLVKKVAERLYKGTFVSQETKKPKITSFIDDDEGCVACSA